MSTWWSRWWYRLCALPAGTVTVEVQDFVDLWARREKDYWDAAVDFVDLSLPFEQMFLVAAAPKRFYADLGGLQPWPRSWPRRWGIYFESVQTDAVWSDDAKIPFIWGVRHGEPDEFVLRGSEAKHLAHEKVIATLFEEGDDSKPVRTAVWNYTLDREGVIPPLRGLPWFGPWDRDAESQQLAEDRLICLHPMMLAISAWNEGAAVLRDGLLPPHFHLKLRPGRLRTIGRPPERELVS